jgi:hypothetical protein
MPKPKTVRAYIRAQAAKIVTRAQMDTDVIEIATSEGQPLEETLYFTRETWWSELNSNCRYRFLNWQTAALWRRLQHTDGSKPTRIGRFGIAASRGQFGSGRRRDDSRAGCNLH